MKYRVAKDSETGKALTALSEQMKAANCAVADWLKLKGFDPRVALDTTCVAGGICGIAFDEKPKDWKQIYESKGVRFYWPIEGRTSTRPVLKELRDLPRVRVFEYNKVIKWDGFLSRYGLADRGEWWLLNVPELDDAGAPEVDGLEEITSAEYVRLLGVKEVASA